MKHVQYLIVGAGPAGLQMAYFLRRNNKSYAVLEKSNCAGSFFATQPRHRSLLSLNKRFNGFPEQEFNMRHDWNSLLTEEGAPVFGEYSKELYPHADDLCRYMEDFSKRHELDIQFDTEVTHIKRKPEGGFSLETLTGTTWSCDVLLMATGAQDPYLPPDIEGIEEAAGYEDHSLDPAIYENSSVLVIGRGNSAFEVANYLAPHAALIHIAIGNRPIDLAWDTHSVRNVRAVNNTVVEMLHVKALHGAVGLNVKKIARNKDGGFDVVAQEEVPNWEQPGILELNLHYDHVIRCTGFRYITPELFDTDIAPETCAKTKYPVLDSSWQSSTPDLYYMGTAMAARDKKSASSFIHGFRYNVRTLFHLLEKRYENTPLPRETHRLDNESDLERLAEHLLSRLSTTAALYQQFGFLNDVLLFESGCCHVYPELPKDYVLESEEFCSGAEMILLSLEYGFDRYGKDTRPLNFITQMDEATSRRCAAYLHPIFRRYKDGMLVEEDNLGESLTLRFSKHRPGASGSNMEVDVEKNIVMNILNRAARVTATVYPETALLENHSLKPWPKDRPINEHNLPRCRETKLPNAAE